jgi:hypothetical protein
MKTLDTNIERASKALLDSGCEGSCIDTKAVEKYQLSVSKLHHPIPVYNADGSQNQARSISGFITMHIRIGEHNERIDLGVTNLGTSEIFLDMIGSKNTTLRLIGGMGLYNSIAAQLLVICQNQQANPQKEPKSEKST